MGIEYKHLTTLFSIELLENKWNYVEVENKRCLFSIDVSKTNPWIGVINSGFQYFAYEVFRGLDKLSSDQKRVINNKLSDHFLTTYSQQVFSLINKHQLIELSPNHLSSIAIFFQGLYIYLSRLNNAIYSKAILFCLWQWYNIDKNLYHEAINNEFGMKVLEKIEWDMAQAYKLLSRCITDLENSSAINWLARTANWNRKILISNTLREKLLRSLILTEKNGYETQSILKSFEENPFYAPGVFDTEWIKYDIHPVFKKVNNKPEVFKLIHSELLPHYDFKSALILSLLASNTIESNIICKRFFRRYYFWMITHFSGFTTLFIFILWIIGLVGIGHWLGFSSGLVQYPLPIPIWISISQIMYLIIPLILLLQIIDINLIGYLVLPRLVGGIIVGYLAFILQDDPNKLVNYIWKESISTGIIKIVILWLVILLFCFYYLKFDIRPIIQDEILAKKRTISLLFISFSFSIFIGLFALSITDNGQSPNYDKWLIGPIGWISVMQLSVYVPLSVFIGFITQFLFEEKSLAASVWSPEEP